MKCTTDGTEITALRELSARIGGDPMLTQASTGNASVKLDGVLWIKASGTWLADAKHSDIFIPVNLEEVRECVHRNVDPADGYAATPGSRPRISVETAMHAVLPHRVVIHVHSVNAIAWAVLQDAPERLAQPLAGLHWEWIPYVPSGLPLAREVEAALSRSPGTGVLLLGNHGLVVGAQDCSAAGTLLLEVERRLAIPGRQAPDADYAVLTRVAGVSGLSLPGDAELHALGTDPAARAILSAGLLYPCQSIFPNVSPLALFRAVPGAALAEHWEERNDDLPFLIVETAGLVMDPTMSPAEYAILRGLARVVQRIDPSAPIRYLTGEEMASGFNMDSYRKPANSNPGPAARVSRAG